MEIREERIKEIVNELDPDKITCPGCGADWNFLELKEKGNMRTDGVIMCPLCITALNTELEKCVICHKKNEISFFPFIKANGVFRAICWTCLRKKGYSKKTSRNKLIHWIKEVIEIRKRAAEYIISEVDPEQLFCESCQRWLPQSHFADAKHRYKECNSCYVFGGKLHTSQKNH